MRVYDAVTVLGRAYNFEKQSYPEHVYESLRVAAQVFHAGRIAGGIAVCGAAERRALEQGMRAPTTEAAEMARYLTHELDVPKSAIYIEDKSTNTPDNFVNLKAIAAAEGWRNIYMPIAEPRVKQAAFLGEKICFRQCDFTMQGLETDEDFPAEAKLLGDRVCTLKDMDWGDHDYLLNADGTSKWDELRKGHYGCEFYVLTNEVVRGIREPNMNFHPEDLMQAHGSLSGSQA